MHATRLVNTSGSFFFGNLNEFSERFYNISAKYRVPVTDGGAESDRIVVAALVLFRL